jgi:WhiB family redox-sensing transcriptional regulator
MGPALLRSELLELRDVDAERRRRVRVQVETVPVESPVPEQSSWRRWAACKGKPVGWWFPTRGDTVLARAAIAVCQGCGVRDRCLAEALAEEAELGAGEVAGIRGGRTAAERLALRRRGEWFAEAL